MNTIIRAVLIAVFLAPGLPASAALKVFACEPEWGALAQAIGGTLVDVYVATSAAQDPHQVQARPSLIAHVRNADLLVCTGAELEIGWLPVLLQQSGNGGVQAGQPGNFAAADYVTKLDVPTTVDRSQGDVHAAGNPHIQTDPRNFALAASALGSRLQQLDPGHATQLAQQQTDFAERWRQAVERWTARAAPLRGVPVVSQHKAYVYLYEWLGMKEVAVLEPKPGVEPSVSHLEQVLNSLKANPARMVLYSAYQDPRPSEWLQRKAGIPAVKMPFTVGGTDGARDLFGLFDDTLTRLLAALTGASS
jgi:zinc/manganese transport system substrate-binding protein